MKRNSIFVFVVSITLSSWLSVHQLVAKQKVIRTNKVLVPKTAETYMEVRHIVLRGKNQAIGEALGELAQEWLDIKPYLYTDPVYGRANQLYLEKNYPIMTKRLKGVARAYHIDPHVYLAGTLLYDLWPSACSVVYFPGDFTSNGHGLIAHNLDFNIVAFSDIFPGQVNKNNHQLFSRSFVIELYPTDGGYSSIGVGSLDLLNGIIDGINSTGLTVSMLVDQDSPKTPELRDLIQSCGLDGLQVVRMLLDTCATVEEAKIALLQNRYVATFRGLHFQVCDRSGRSVICEIDPKTFLWHFTDNNNQIQVMTNHAQHLHPDIASFPVSEHPYSSFNRYKKLHEFVTAHQKKFSREDALMATSLVYGDRNFPGDVPMRTLWTQLYDQVDKTLQVRFYLRDGEKDSKTGAVTSVFSDYFTFKLGA